MSKYDQRLKSLHLEYHAARCNKLHAEKLRDADCDMIRWFIMPVTSYRGVKRYLMTNGVTNNIKLANVYFSDKQPTNMSDEYMAYPLMGIIGEIIEDSAADCERILCDIVQLSKAYEK